MDAQGTSRNDILARLQDIFRAELDDDDLQITALRPASRT